MQSMSNLSLGTYRLPTCACENMCCLEFFLFNKKDFTLNIMDMTYLQESSSIHWLGVGYSCCCRTVSATLLPYSPVHFLREGMNFEGSEERQALFHGEHGNTMAYIQQAANAAITGAIGSSGFAIPPVSKKRKGQELFFGPTTSKDTSRIACFSA